MRELFVDLFQKKINTNRRRGINFDVEPNVDINVPLTNAIANPIGFF